MGGLQILTAPANVGARVAFSPDGRLLAAVGSRDRPAPQKSTGVVALWEVRSGRLLQLLEADTLSLFSLAFSSDGLRLAAGGHDRQVREWVVASGRMNRLYPTGDGARLFAVAYSPDDETLAAIADQGKITLWDTRTGRRRWRIRRGYERGNDLAFSPSGEWLAAAVDLAAPDSEEAPEVHETLEAVKLLEVRTGRLVWTLRERSVGAVAFSPEGKLLAVMGTLTLSLWNPQMGRLIKRLFRHRDSEKAFQTIAFAPDGRRLASGQADGTVRVWEVATSKVLRTRRLDAAVASLAFSPDGQAIAIGRFVDRDSGERRDRVQIWHL